MKQRSRTRIFAFAVLVFLATARLGMAADVNQAGTRPDATKIKDTYEPHYSS